MHLNKTKHSCSIFHDLHDIGVDMNKIKDCIGDLNADVENPILKAEQDAQVGIPQRFLYGILVGLFFY
jgi:hypothetical protein